MITCYVFKSSYCGSNEVPNSISFFHNSLFEFTLFSSLNMDLKFIYSEKATKICKISTVDLSYVVPVKSTVEISQNFVAFSENMNFTKEKMEQSVRKIVVRWVLLNKFQIKTILYTRNVWPPRHSFVFNSIIAGVSFTCLLQSVTNHFQNKNQMFHQDDWKMCS